MSEKVNLLFIITDQQRADHLSCTGNPMLKTPHLDSIAQKGVRFSKYFCTTPICMPNRASFFTGVYPSIHGTRSNGINLNPEIPTLSGILKNHGYHTVSIGKMHFNFYAFPYKKKTESLEIIPYWISGKLKLPFPTPYYGFDEVILTAGHGDVMGGHYMEWLEKQKYEQLDFLKNRLMKIYENYYETVLPEELYPTAYITDQTINFLERFSEGKYGDKPFFLHCSYNDPHHPVCPPGKYKDMYKPDDVQLPSNFNNAKNLLDHKFLGEILRDSRFPHLLPQKVDETVAKTFTALTYGSIAMIDDGVGRILRTIEKTGMSDNTIVIFTSDHGDYCGDHGLILKGPAHYRSIINMPLLWKVPGLTKSGVSDSLISTVDLPKTILNLLGIREKFHPEGFQGYDITPILNDPNEKVRECLHIEHDEEIATDRIFRVRTLITERYRLSLYDGHEDIFDIFDYESDPNEIDNLSRKNRELKNDLTEKLLREIIKINPRLPKRTAYN